MDAHALEHDVGSDLAARLREAITRGEFMPNERLIETELARTYGTNRANVRIALAMLDQEGLVVRERNRGARVRLVSEKEALEIAELRQAIEAMLARQAAQTASASDRRSLRAILDTMAMAFAKQDFIRFSQLNADLHREIQRIAGNATANRVLQSLKSQVVRLQYRAILLPGRPELSLAEHGAIVHAICAGDGVAAEKAMRHHLAMVKDALERAIRVARLGGF